MTNIYKCSSCGTICSSGRDHDMFECQYRRKSTMKQTNEWLNFGGAAHKKYPVGICRVRIEHNRIPGVAGQRTSTILELITNCGVVVIEKRIGDDRENLKCYADFLFGEE